MKFLSVSSFPLRKIALLGASSTGLLLGGCYVVPIQSGHYPAQVAPVAMAPAPLSFSARLYPSNDQASALGVVSATVSSDLSGRGQFSAVIAGESFSGESTRLANSSREGIANGSGNRGSYINCRYAMNSPTLGTGTCKLSTGAQFNMHIGG